MKHFFNKKKKKRRKIYIKVSTLEIYLSMYTLVVYIHAQLLLWELGISITISIYPVG